MLEGAGVFLMGWLWERDLRVCPGFPGRRRKKCVDRSGGFFLAHTTRMIVPFNVGGCFLLVEDFCIGVCWDYGDRIWFLGAEVWKEEERRKGKGREGGGYGYFWGGCGGMVEEYFSWQSIRSPSIGKLRFLRYDVVLFCPSN